MVKVFERVDLGVVDFGRYMGYPWSKVPESYLRYLVSPECHTTDERKAKARQELQQRQIAAGQISLFEEAIDEN